ncbi:hypothetical protein VNO77_08269 [Canavalia gladiata]|uniref:Uncharacterized protein n=1 Tax=Canavalia gladiata TaxID=3824 RepID=A0AAN9MDY4_CANGL
MTPLPPIAAPIMILQVCHLSSVSVVQRTALHGGPLCISLLGGDQMIILSNLLDISLRCSSCMRVQLQTKIEEFTKNIVCMVDPLPLTLLLGFPRRPRRGLAILSLEHRWRPEWDYLFQERTGLLKMRVGWVVSDYRRGRGGQGAVALPDSIASWEFSPLFFNRLGSRLSLSTPLESRYNAYLQQERGSCRSFSTMAAPIRSSDVASDDLVDPLRRVLRL